MYCATEWAMKGGVGCPNRGMVAKKIIDSCTKTVE